MDKKINLLNDAVYKLDVAINQAKVNTAKAKIFFVLSLVMLLITIVAVPYILKANSNFVLAESPSLILLLIIFLGSIYVVITSYFHFRKSINDIHKGEHLRSRISDRKHYHAC